MTFASPALAQRQITDRNSQSRATQVERKTLVKQGDGTFLLPSQVKGGDATVIGPQITAEEMASVFASAEVINAENEAAAFRLINRVSGGGTEEVERATLTKPVLVALRNYGVILLVQSISGMQIDNIRLVVDDVTGVENFAIGADGKSGLVYGSGTLYRFTLPNAGQSAYSMKVSKKSVNFAQQPTFVGGWMFAEQGTYNAPLYAEKIVGNTTSGSFDGKTFDCGTRRLTTDGTNLIVLTGCGELRRFAVNAETGIAPTAQGTLVATGIERFIDHMTVVRTRIVLHAPSYSTYDENSPTQTKTVNQAFLVAYNSTVTEIVASTALYVPDYLDFLSSDGDMLLMGERPSGSSGYGSVSRLILLGVDNTVGKFIKANYNFTPNWISLDFVQKACTLSPIQ